MSQRIKSILAALVLGVTAGGVEALAQQPQPSTAAPAVQPQQPRKERGRRRGMRGRRGNAIQQLNLTDQQREQMRSIMQANRQSFQAQRQEMRELNRQWREGTLSPQGLERAKALRAQLIENRKAIRGQMDGILTTEQKTKLEEMRKMRRTNHERVGRRKQGEIQ
jgi:Spy/CpxP family protein refolding chaperone